MLANEIKQFFIVHEGLLSVTAGHNEDIKGPGFRDSYVRSEPQPLDVANGSKFSSHGGHRRIGHARKNFKWSGEVDLVHSGINQTPDRNLPGPISGLCPGGDDER